MVAVCPSPTKLPIVPLNRLVASRTVPGNCPAVSWVQPHIDIANKSIAERNECCFEGQNRVLSIIRQHKGRANRTGMRAIQLAGQTHLTCCKPLKIKCGLFRFGRAPMPGEHRRPRRVAVGAHAGRFFFEPKFKNIFDPHSSPAPIEGRLDPLRTIIRISSCIVSNLW